MKKLILIALFAASFSSLVCGAPLGTGFTYQGKLSDGSGPATGVYDLRFAIYDAGTVGNQLGSTVTLAGTPVTNGLFTVTLDFGAVFDGNARWLDIAVRPAGGAAFTNLVPRQGLSAAPYATYAPNAGSAPFSISWDRC